MLQWEGVEHNKKRGPVVKRIRSPRAVRESIDAQVVEIARRQADGLVLGEPVDLRADYAMWIPLLVITELLDVHEATRFRGWYDAIAKGGISSISNPELRVAGFEALDALREVVAPVVEERRAQPGQRHDLRPRHGDLRRGAVSRPRRSSRPSPSCSRRGSRRSSAR